MSLGLDIDRSQEHTLFSVAIRYKGPTYMEDYLLSIEYCIVD